MINSSPWTVIKQNEAPNINIDTNRDNKPDINIDKTGKQEGRGAYICDNINCLEKAIKANRLEKAFDVKIEEQIYDKLRGVIVDK